MDTLLCCGIVFVWIGFLTDWCLRLIDRYGPGINLDRQTYLWILACCAADSVLIGWGWADRGEAAALAAGSFAAYLICASVTDVKTFEVYDFLHLIGAGAGVFLVVWEGRPGSVWISLAVFALLQHFLFCRMYGEADGRVFFVCALFEAADGGGMLRFLLHMGTALAALAAVQAFKGNIGRDGNLKQKAAFVPYIAAVAWLFV